MRRVILVFCIAILAGLAGTTEACTTFIITGKYTVDGRPILYKHRDAGTLDNALVYFTDGKYNYIGLVDSKDSWQKELWGGYNSAGFAIINSAAYNNNIGDTTKLKDKEGEVMKVALQTCATLADFENLLRDLPKPLGVDANFGVIDANGGAAYYETGNYGFKKIDANDPSVAPYGYLIRTNHSFTGAIDKGAGYIRYATASEALNMAAALKELEPQYLLNHISRNLYHSLTKENLRERIPANSKEPVFRYFEDFIPRNSSASVVMIVGVKKGEDVSHTMMWTLTGFPLSTVAVPVWVSAGKDLPKIVSMKDDLHSPICDAAMALKHKVFPIERGSGYKYIDLSVLLNQEGTGIMQQLEPVENEIFKKTEAMLKVMPEGKLQADKVRELYRWLDSYIPQAYKELFGIEIK